MQTDAYSDAFSRLLKQTVTLAQVRRIEAGESHNGLWKTLHASGFADIMVAEAAGGAGQSLADAFPLLLACGAAALPVPMAPTMVARALLADAGRSVPTGPIALARGARDETGRLWCRDVNWGMTAEWLLVEAGSECLLVETAHAHRERAGTHGSLLADLYWEDEAPAGLRLEGCPKLRYAGAALLAAHIAGAMQAVLERTAAYASERKQFGKPIGRFQAIQQQLSVMAEQAAAARMAAQIGCLGGGHGRRYLPLPMQAAVAKARSSEAVVPVANIAHAVHGAIGVTHELDLHLLTRRLHEWRLSAGSESYWHGVLGRELLRQDHGTLDFIRAHIGRAPTQRQDA